MDPLQSIPMPTHGVLVGITTANSWAGPTEPLEHSVPSVRTAYIATNSTEKLSFVTLQSATHAGHIVRLTSRPSHFEDMLHGVVVEIHLSIDLEAGDIIHVSLAQAGASTYFPPQQIDDLQ